MNWNLNIKIKKENWKGNKRLKENIMKELSHLKEEEKIYQKSCLKIINNFMIYNIIF